MLADYTGVPVADVNRFIDDDMLLAPPEVDKCSCNYRGPAYLGN